MKKLKYLFTNLAIALALFFTNCSSDSSNNIVPFQGYPIPEIPTEIQALPGIGQNTIQWRPSKWATSYNIYWKLESGVTT